jgi:hypothetical protein
VPIRACVSWPIPEPQGASQQTHHYLHSTEAAVRAGRRWRGWPSRCARRVSYPDVICAHPGWGEALFLKDAFPTAKLLLYLEFFYRAHGSDMGFDAEFPTSLR